MNTSMVTTIAAAVLIALGGFLIYVYGMARYANGYDTCVIDMQNVNAKTAQQLEDQRDKDIKPDNVIRILDANGWLRPDTDI